MTMRILRWVSAGTAALTVLLGGATAAVQARPDATRPTKPTTIDATDARQLERHRHPKMHRALVDRFRGGEDRVKAWVFFADKGVEPGPALEAAVEHVAATYNPRAARRRVARGTNTRAGAPAFDARDLPVAAAYVEAVRATGAEVHVTSKWVNAASVRATWSQLQEIAKLPFVTKLQPVARARRIDTLHPRDMGDGPFPRPDAGVRGLDYGSSFAQLDQINLIALHEQGFTGEGVIVGILDTGFQRSHVAFTNPEHPLHVIAEYDFVDDDEDTSSEPGDPFSQHDHGTMILGVLGAYQPGSLVGGAFDASFVLAKTEDTAGEYPAEEDNFVAGLEFIESHGADMSTASLGYIDWYTQADLDGLTAVTTIAVNTLTSHGVHHCNAAGNEYHDSDPTTSSLIAPADAFQVITCGAVNSSGTIASFSSEGPTADGRVKPEVLARGVSTHTVSPSSDSSYTTADGTSLSTPVVACAVACLVQAKPYWTVDDMRQHMFETATDFVASGTYDPLFIRGYGIVDAFAAYDTCSDAGTVTRDRGRYACESVMGILVNDCGLNTDDSLVETVGVRVDSDSETGVEEVTLTETDPASAEFAGSIALSETDGPGVLLVSDGEAVVVTYIDADDGQGGVDVEVTASAAVDCQPPVIEEVAVPDVAPRSATVRIAADEPVVGTVHYGPSCDALTETATGSGYDNPAAVRLGGLMDDTMYFLAVDASDEAGNTSSDDHGGACYTFTTPQVPDFFTEQFTEGGSPVDLANLSLTFVPNGSYDYYAGCVVPIVELPTDPAGGTVLDLSDDSSRELVLAGGATVTLYGQSYGSLFAGSNGYVTFGSGNTDYSETLEDHFLLPRISALFDDLNPGAGGTVSWRQLPDRVAVTYEDVPEYSVGGANTFQIEAYFDGTIVVSYLGLTAADGIAGLSAGDGLDPDFYPTDLSAMGSCGPRPPWASDVSVSTPVGEPIGIELRGGDDGLPDPPGLLTYVITTLPTHGTLRAGEGAPIETVPYALTPGSALVTYAPHSGYGGPDEFRYKVDDGGEPPGGGESSEATVLITVGGPQRVYSFPFDADPGWTMQGNWGFGVPTGGGTHDGDPTSGFTGENVLGYNLSGDYTDNMPVYYATTYAIDCSELTDVELRFRRWLGVESSSFDHATVEVSADGLSWETVWEHSGAALSESSWSEQRYDLSSVADGASTVYVRWGMGPTDGSVTYPGWNIDDVEVWGVVPVDGPQLTAARSVAYHEPFGAYAGGDESLPIDLAVGLIEPREQAGGGLRVALEFDRAVSVESIEVTMAPDPGVALAVVAGASETELELQFAGDVARGGYRVTVATAGGALTEFPLCYVAGDVNCSGDVTGLDLAAIQSPAYWNLDLLAAPSARADVNRDGRMTGLDLARVQSPANWNQPTPPVSECGCPRLD